MSPPAFWQLLPLWWRPCASSSPARQPDSASAQRQPSPTSATSPCATDVIRRGSSRWQRRWEESPASPTWPTWGRSGPQRPGSGRSTPSSRTPRSRSCAGRPRAATAWRRRLAVNHLAHLALIDDLLGSATPPRRVVLLSSDTHDAARRTGTPAPLEGSVPELARPSAVEGTASELGMRRYVTTKQLATAVCPRPGSRAPRRARHRLQPGRHARHRPRPRPPTVTRAAWAVASRLMLALPFASTACRFRASAGPAGLRRPATGADRHLRGLPPPGAAGLRRRLRPRFPAPGAGRQQGPARLAALIRLPTVLRRMNRDAKGTCRRTTRGTRAHHPIAAHARPPIRR